MNMNLPIITGRLVLRRFAMDDVQALLELVRDPSVVRVMRGIEPTEASVRNYLATQTSYHPFEQDNGSMFSSMGSWTGNGKPRIP